MNRPRFESIIFATALVGVVLSLVSCCVAMKAQKTPPPGVRATCTDTLYDADGRVVSERVRVGPCKR